MKAKLFCSLAFLILFVLPSRAQLASFKVLDHANDRPLEGARVFSLQHATDYKTTGADGKALIDITKIDTLVIIKDYYFPVYLTVDHHQFDFSHSITVEMIHSGENIHTHQTSNISSLQSFEYHFVHDNPQEKANLKLTYFSHAAGPKPTSSGAEDKAFKFTEIPLDRFSIHPHHSSGHSYRLK